MLADPPRDTVVLRILFTEDRWLSFLLAPDAHDLHRWAWTAGWAYRRARATASASLPRRPSAFPHLPSITPCATTRPPPTATGSPSSGSPISARPRLSRSVHPMPF